MPIPATRSAKRVEENIAAAGLVPTDADLGAIRTILPDGGYGSRYPEGFTPPGSEHCRTGDQP